MEIREKIKAAGLKATPQRRLVYEVMQELCHSPIDEVITRAQSVSPDVTISTVYRILESFCSAGLLSKINHPDGKTYFDITPQEHHHIFNSSGSIIDFEDEQLSELIRMNLKHKLGSGETIQKIQIQVITTKN